MIGKVTHLRHKTVGVRLTLNNTVREFSKVRIIRRPLKYHAALPVMETWAQDKESFLFCSVRYLRKTQMFKFNLLHMIWVFFFLAKDNWWECPLWGNLRRIWFLICHCGKVRMNICMKNSDTRSWVNRKHSKQPEIIHTEGTSETNPTIFLSILVTNYCTKKWSCKL